MSKWVFVGIEGGKATIENENTDCVSHFTAAQLGEQIEHAQKHDPARLDSLQAAQRAMTATLGR